MHRTDALLIAAILVLAPFATPAEAHGGWRGGPRWSVGVGIGIGVPWGYGYAYPPPYYYYPAPAPAPVYVVPPVEPAPAPPLSPDPIFYPRNGQSAEQTEADRQACNRWAVTQRDAMANASVFHRATLACMEGRGYTVR